MGVLEGYFEHPPKCSLCRLADKEHLLVSHSLGGTASILNGGRGAVISILVLNL